MITIHMTSTSKCTVELNNRSCCLSRVLTTKSDDSMCVKIGTKKSTQQCDARLDQSYFWFLTTKLSVTSHVMQLRLKNMRCRYQVPSTFVEDSDFVANTLDITQSKHLIWQAKKTYFAWSLVIPRTTKAREEWILEWIEMIDSSQRTACELWICTLYSIT